MDKEAQGKIDATDFIIPDIGKPVRIDYIIVNGEIYHKLPKGKPPILTPQQFAICLFKNKSGSQSRLMEAIAQAQRDSDIKFYEGLSPKFPNSNK